MITIIGRKIILQQGDTESFRIIIIDSKGNEVPLARTDVITLRMRYSRETEEPITYKKVADVIELDNGGTVYHIMSFLPEDTINLPEGDYEYDVILENENKRFTIVPTSILTLEKSLWYDKIVDNRDPDTTVYETKIDYYSVIAATPLIGRFPEISYLKVGGAVDEEIILF